MGRMLVIFLNLLSCLVYSLILYHWYSTFRYISAENRKSRQVIAKKLFIAINIHFIVYYAICILIGCGYDTIRPGDYVYMLLRVYQMYLLLILFCWNYYILESNCLNRSRSIHMRHLIYSYFLYIFHRQFWNSYDRYWVSAIIPTDINLYARLWAFSYITIL